MKRITAAIAAILLVTAITSCGGGTNSKDLPATSKNFSGALQSSQKTDNTNGYTADMSATAGLNMEKSTVSDIESKFGTPSDSKSYKLFGIDCTELTYPFGTLYFEDRSGSQVLTFATVTGKLPTGIGGVNIGDDLYTAADTLYPDCSNKIKEALKIADTGIKNHVLFYGSLQNEDFVPPYGVFQLIDTEQSSADCMYSLEYAVSSEVSETPHKINFTFSSNMKLTQIMINCSEIF